MTYSLYRINSSSDIKNFLRKDNLYHSILQVSDLDKWIPDTIFTAWFIFQIENKKAGIIAIKEFSSNCVEFHGGLLEHYRNKDTINMLKYCLTTLRIKDSTYVTKVPESNKKCLAMLKKYGFKELTIIKNAYKTDNLVLLGE